MRRSWRGLNARIVLLSAGSAALVLDDHFAVFPANAGFGGFDGGGGE